MWKCLKCNNDLKDDVDACFNCGADKPPVIQRCRICNKQIRVQGFLKSFFNAYFPEGEIDEIIKIKGEYYCRSCGAKYIKDSIDKIQLTTTNNIDGYMVKRYIDIISVEVVIGTGVFSEISTDF